MIIEVGLTLLLTLAVATGDISGKLWGRYFQWTWNVPVNVINQPALPFLADGGAGSDLYKKYVTNGKILR